MTDLSVSRASLTWGVPVPGDPVQVMYVWVDALANYITALGYPDTAAERWAFWPADIHFVGKDIARFHAVIWPALLMAAGLPVPKRVYANGWWTVEGEKMSKSVGNVVDPRDLVAEFGLDVLRYFLLREMPFGNDGDFNRRALIGRMNSELANDLGNLAQRSLSLIAKNCGGVLPERGPATEDDAELLAQAAALPDAMRPKLLRQAYGEALDEAWRVIRAANAYIDRQAPWALRKTDPVRMAAVLRVLADVLRPIATVLQPFMPGSMAAMLDQLGVPADARSLAALARRCRRHPAAAAPGHLPALRRRSGVAGMLIDSHCHLDYFTDELDGVLSRAAAAGVGEMVTIGTTLDQSRSIRTWRQRMRTSGAPSASIRKAPPRHPCPRRRRSPAWRTTRRSSASASPGSTTSTTPRRKDVQQASFRAHIRAARLAGLPLCIHARDADDDIAAILREEREEGGPYDFLLHCFSSGRGLAEAALAMGGYVSFSGILTFPKSTENRDIARDVPADRLLVETDSPYLAPVPFRGKRNEPAYVAKTAAVLAEVRGLTPEALAELTTANFRRLFRRAA